MKNEITVINFPNKEEIARRLTEVSSAINKLNILVYQGKVGTVNMEKCAEEVSAVWELLNSLTIQTEVIRG